MNTKMSNAPAPRRFARKVERQKPSVFTTLRSLAGFLIMMGLLVTGSGLICLIPFHNRVSKLILIIGLCLFLFGFAIKIIDISAKIVGGRK